MNEIEERLRKLAKQIEMIKEVEEINPSQLITKDKEYLIDQLDATTQELESLYKDSK